MHDKKAEKNPFQIQSTKSVYENAWIRVIEHQVINPKGKPGIYGVVQFKNRAIGIIPYENGNVWLVGQHRFPLDEYSWEIPEGGSPKHEELIETAKRELKEETGFEADSYELILQMHLSNSVSDEYAAIFLAQGLKAGESSPEETEELKVKRVSLNEAYEMVVTGEITDSLTVAGILRLQLMRHEGKIR